jgi:hypothetical protein
LSQYLDLYWKHLSQYYQNGKITREQWLQQCNQIKPQTHFSNQLIVFSRRSI